MRFHHSIFVSVLILILAGVWTWAAPSGSHSRKVAPIFTKPSPQGTEQAISIGLKLVRIHPGEFTMGSPPSEENRMENEVSHRVKITRPFSMGIYPITRGQFAIFTRDSGYKTDAETDGNAWDFPGGKWTKVPQASWRNPGFGQTDDDPVVNVSWNDAVIFCNWLSRKENKTYRLPTEAEWEYACRAGTTTAYYNGNDEKKVDAIGWHLGNSGKHTHPVGQLAPNAWGLHDMLGNVFQWCGDFYGDYDTNEVQAIDPVGPIVGQEHPGNVARGGSWTNEPLFLSSRVSVQHCRA